MMLGLSDADCQGVSTCTLYIPSLASWEKINWNISTFPIITPRHVKDQISWIYQQ